MTPVFWIIIWGLSGIAAAFAARFFLLRRNIREVRAQMERINGEPGTNERLACASPDAGFAALLAEVNKALEKSQEMRIGYEIGEREFKRQISNISHDLRTPLTSVLGYLELLEADAADGGEGGTGTLSEDERREYLAVVIRKSKSLRELIGQFYEMARLDSGEYKLEMEQTNLCALLGQALSAFYRDLEEGPFQTEVDLEEPLPPVWADVGAVNRIFLNLLQNILGHSSRGRVSISQKLDGNGIVTRFANEAEGISEEDMAHIFERFYTADQMRTGQNTGLGMTIVKRLLEQMGHQITARLEPLQSEPDAAGEKTAEKTLFVVEIRWQSGFRRSDIAI